MIFFVDFTLNLFSFTLPLLIDDHMTLQAKYVQAIDRARVSTNISTSKINTDASEHLSAWGECTCLLINASLLNWTSEKVCSIVFRFLYAPDYFFTFDLFCLRLMHEHFFSYLERNFPECLVCGVTSVTSTRTTVDEVKGNIMHKALTVNVVHKRCIWLAWYTTNTY